jgi:hypothetical protein
MRGRDTGEEPFLLLVWKTRPDERRRERFFRKDIMQ